MAYLLFDIGGTKTRLALSLDGKSFLAPVIFPTPSNFDEAVKLLGEEARKISLGQKILQAAGGVAGTLNRDRTSLLRATNLAEWQDQPLKEALEAEWGAPVTLENDAAVVGLGEAVFGAGQNYQSVAYLTVSTGVGGAKIEQGKIAAHTYGFEPGFQIINYLTGETLEAISGTTVAQKFGLEPKEITDPVIWSEAAKLLAVGVHNALVFWSPEVVVLGGSMMRAPAGISVAAVALHLATLPSVFKETVPLKSAVLGDLGGLYGALNLLSL